MADCANHVIHKLQSKKLHKIFFSKNLLPLVTIKVLAFFPPGIEHICEKARQHQCKCKCEWAMIGRVKTFSLSSITGLFWDDIKYVIVKVLWG